MTIKQHFNALRPTVRKEPPCPPALAPTSPHPPQLVSNISVWCSKLTPFFKSRQSWQDPPTTKFEMMHFVFFCGSSFAVRLLQFVVRLLRFVVQSMTKFGKIFKSGEILLTAQEITKIDHSTKPKRKIKTDAPISLPKLVRIAQ